MSFAFAFSLKFIFVFSFRTEPQAKSFSSRIYMQLPPSFFFFNRWAFSVSVSVAIDPHHFLWISLFTWFIIHLRFYLAILCSICIFSFYICTNASYKILLSSLIFGTVVFNLYKDIYLKKYIFLFLSIFWKDFHFHIFFYLRNALLFYSYSSVTQRRDDRTEWVILKKP